MGFLAAAPLLMSVLGGTATAGAAAGAASAMTIASTALGVTSAVVGGVSAMSQANYQAKVANRNAQVLEQQTQSTLQMGQKAESDSRLKTSELVGQQMATQAANGVDVGVGSAKLVRASTRDMGDADALTLRYNAAREAYGQEVEAVNQRAQAKQAKAAGKFALANSFLGAASSLTGGLGKMASMKMANKAYGVGAP